MLVNKTYLRIFIFTGLIIFGSSCGKDFLEVKPPTSLLAPDALKTEADLQVAARGMYSGMRVSTLYGRDAILFGDLMADVTYVSPQNSNRFINQNRYTPGLQEGTGIWSAAYTVILRANNIINATVDANTNVNQAKGEAYAARALMYFDLVRFFAKPYTDDPNTLGVPIVLDYNPNLLPKRDTLKKVYSQIITDLNQAFDLMTVFTNSSYLNKWAARGLLAKVYLTMGDYVNAKAAAIDVINNSGFSVVTGANYVSYWKNPTPRTDKVETLFEVSSDIVNNAGSNSLADIYSQSGAYGDMVASHEFYGTYDTEDFRRDPTILVPKTRGGETAITVEKYSNAVNANERDDVKILRMSDVYLIAAEASYRTGNETDAKTYLNYVATRRIKNFTGYTSSGATLLNDILNERRKELAFEGDRLHTLNRLKLAIVRSTDYPVDARNIAYWDYRRILAIPLEEMQANPENMIQNDGYK